MRASLVVVVWNGIQFLRRCLQSLTQELAASDELIVVDNASTDGSVDFVTEHFPGARLARLPSNLGYAGGVNYGLSLARGQQFFIFNQDLELRPGWLSHMSTVLAELSVGVVGCKILYPDGRLQHAGGMIRWPQALPDHHGHRQPDDGRWDQAREVDYVTGAAWGFSETLVGSIGTLDPTFWPGYFEEVDFCFRAADAGFEVRYVPEAVAVHVESTTLKQGSDRYLRAFHKNRLRFVFKRLTPEQFLEHFIPAEAEWLAQDRKPHERYILGSVYKLSFWTASSVYAAKKRTFQDMQHVIGGLLELWHRARALNQ
jgi:GT2 family glycosyltransferase